ncbi:hypothetical protein [uncultured Paraglaciecola sp.]|uniref:hypothetical protein n=1 Tax=uncultured Paraglaciecola sp. TaxID=1765024 RepID=UPI0030D7ECD8|tara:strand:+ start:98803 stop:99126 length:324 start_codon:yes stop_codon:yes gene_type:complete
MNISNNVNSAIVSGTIGIQRASDGITQNASNLASLSAFVTPSSDPQEFLANATLNQLNAIKQTLPQGSEGITSNLVGLSVNLNNAQASAKVVDTANGTIGTILDILA